MDSNKQGYANHEILHTRTKQNNTKSAFVAPTTAKLLGSPEHYSVMFRAAQLFIRQLDKEIFEQSTFNLKVFKLISKT